MKKLLPLLLLFVIILSAIVLADSKLEITELVVKVNGDRESADESGGTIKVPPASTLNLKVTVESLFDKDIEGEDIDIENVFIEAILEEIDDGDDLDEESDDKDISPGRDSSFTLEFELPLRIDHDETYVLTVTATGEDEDGVEHTAEVVFDVEADKESHEIRFLKQEISPSTVKCSGSPRLLVELINTGENDEDVEMTIQNTALKYLAEKEFEMFEDVTDSDNEYTFQDTLSIGSDVEAGTYPFQIVVKYRDGREVLTETVDLTVESCVTTPAPKVEPKVEPKEEPKEEPKTTTVTTQPQVIYVPQPTTTVATSSPQPAVKATAVSKSGDSWFEKNKTLALFIITDVILLIIGLAVVIALLRRKN